MEIGKRIKMLRSAKNVTQEILANELNVTPQAVSRWENGLAMPDITLLPALSVFFGVRIDEFFELSDDAQFKRIENMMDEDFLSRSDFDYAERFLKDRIALDPEDARSLRYLADLYNHRAEGYQRKAETLVKRSLELEPDVKAGYSILSYAANGACFDWCSDNHRELIDYYYGFVEKNPGYFSGYRWLLDNLIADYRYLEAETVIGKMEQVKSDYVTSIYKGFVMYQLGHRDEAEKLWQQTLEDESDNWLAWSFLGDVRVKQCQYDEAVECYTKAAELETVPRYIDNYYSIAQISEIRGKWNEAADAYEKVLEILREDERMTEGFIVDKYRSDILRCRAKEAENYRAN